MFLSLNNRHMECKGDAGCVRAHAWLVVEVTATGERPKKHGKLNGAYYASPASV